MGRKGPSYHPIAPYGSLAHLDPSISRKGQAGQIVATGVARLGRTDDLREPAVGGLGCVLLEHLELRRLDALDRPTRCEGRTDLGLRHATRSRGAGRVLGETQQVQHSPGSTAEARLATYRTLSASSKTWNTPQSMTVAKVRPSRSSASTSPTSNDRVEPPRSRLGSGQIDGRRRRVDAQHLHATLGDEEGVLACPTAAVEDR